jgi:hypothetical protein
MRGSVGFGCDSSAAGATRSSTSATARCVSELGPRGPGAWATDITPGVLQQRTGRRAAVKVVNRVTLTAADEDALRTEVDILRDL